MATSPRAAFVLVLREHRRIGRRIKTMYDGKGPLSVEWLATLERELAPHAHRHRRRPPGWMTEHARTVLGDDQYDALRAPFEKRATELYDDLWSRRRLLELVLRELAPAAEVRAGALRRYEWIYGENNQGFGNRRYTRGSAQLVADHLRFHGVEPDVRGDDVHPPKDYRGDRACWSPCYEVWAPLRSDVDVQILKHRPGPGLREQVRMCWKRGVNPRVYNPWLPVGYEERAGLDYFGGEVRHG